MKMDLLLAAAAALAFSTAAPAGDVPNAPKPSAEHQRLGYFVGEWTSEGEMKESPMGPAGKLTTKDSCEWFKGEFAVVCRATGTSPAGPTKALGILGYSTEEKAYTYYGIDNSGYAQVTVPRGVVDGDTWTWVDESKMGGKMVKSRYVVKEQSASSYTFRWELQDEGGKWVTLLEGTQSRVGAKKKEPKAKEKK